TSQHTEVRFWGAKPIVVSEVQGEVSSFIEGGQNQGNFRLVTVTALGLIDDAVVAFKSKDLDTASINLSATLDNSVTCEDQFKDKKGETSSPLTKENNVYFQLNFWLTVLPLGVAKTLIQTNPDKNCSRNPFRILSSIYQKAGFKGCYTGLGPTVSRAFPANAATIVAWELALKMLGIKHD
ncbi:uncharacterized protein, partial [Glycine max]|uniref:uncharacterized protein n=1 Tax=Glycine max TaxID=3847 RepID=UPI001B357207